MTAFACMFLVKVAVKYGGDLVDPLRVWDMTTRLVKHFRALPTGKWHLAHLMAPGLEKMIATLDPNRVNQAARMQAVGAVDFGANGMMGSSALSNGMDQTMAGAEGDLFFDYGMSFGLSPVFRFDPSSLGLGEMFEPSGVDYGMPDTGSTHYQKRSN